MKYYDSLWFSMVLYMWIVEDWGMGRLNILKYRTPSNAVILILIIYFITFNAWVHNISELITYDIENRKTTENKIIWALPPYLRECINWLMIYTRKIAHCSNPKASAAIIMFKIRHWNVALCLLDWIEWNLPFVCK